MKVDEVRYLTLTIDRNRIGNEEVDGINAELTRLLKGVGLQIQDVYSGLTRIDFFKLEEDIRFNLLRALLDLFVDKNWSEDLKVTLFPKNGFPFDLHQ